MLWFHSHILVHGDVTPESVPLRTQTAPQVALIGMVGLASAMGIGRFAFTPALPLMQAEGLSWLAGSWLASANYAGYLLGALACIVLPQRPAVWARVGLCLVAITTLAVTLSDNFWLWLWWRWLAGVASAFVLVGISAWSLMQLAVLGRGRLAGVIYAGVGMGVMLAGLVGLVAGQAHWSSQRFWWWLGLLALSVWLWGRGSISAGVLSQSTEAAPTSQHLSWNHFPLLLSYGALGLGYILPATFLPALARAQLHDPTLFGWVWPLFGLAAVLSTLSVSFLLGHWAPRRVWGWAAVVMAVGVLLPALAQGLAVLLISAACVGGTFMVITMAGMQEARLQGGARLMAAMTASFACGQMVGPLLLNLTAGDLTLPSLAGGALLLLSAPMVMWRNVAPAQS